MALSLASLQRRLAAQEGRRRAEDLDALGGLNRICGFVSADDGDIVLFGRHDPVAPAAEIDSLVVALRNAYEAGEQYRGALGCTIDPREGDDSWSIQDVGVFAMPPSASMARRFVELDYELKLIGAGIEPPPAPYVRSAFSLLREGSPLCADSNTPHTSTRHRYWFYEAPGGRPRFEATGRNARILSPTGVQLLTEKEFHNKQGQRTGATQAAPSAQQFADGVTELLASESAPRYASLVQDFRLIELAALMRFRGVEPTKLSYLVHEHRLAEHEFMLVVAGVLREESGSTTCRSKITRDGRGIHIASESQQYRYEYRGGVEAKISMSAADIRPGGSELERLRTKILAARPSEESLGWQF